MRPNKEKVAPEKKVFEFWNFDIPAVIAIIVPDIVNGIGKIFDESVLSIY
jgi:hypothetical protein